MYSQHRKLPQFSLGKTLILALALISVHLGCRHLGLNRLKSAVDQDGSVECSDTSRHVTNRRLLEAKSAPTDKQRTKEDVECSEVHNVESSEKCDFMKTTSDCHLSDGFFQYLQFPYCSLPHATSLAFILMFLWLVFLFIVLGTTADEYFCPSLSVISKTLRLSQNVAGVTFLAYGNGAPDIFSAIAAFRNAKSQNGAELGIQALFGAGMFVTTVVVGVVSFTSTLRLTSRPFTRDVLFYLGAVAWTFITLYKENITLNESIGFIVFYVAYVIVVIASRFIYQRYMKQRRIPAESSETETTGNDVDSTNQAEERPSSSVVNPDPTRASSRVQQHTISDALYATETTVVASALHDAPQLQSVLSGQGSSEKDEEIPLLGYSRTGSRPSAVKALLAFLRALVPIDLEEWSDCGVLWKMFLICKAPAVFFLNITIPVVDYDADHQRWNKWLNVLHCITVPMFTIFLTKVNSALIANRFPVWALTLCIAGMLALVVAMTTSHDRQPRFYWMFAYLAFASSVIWIYSTANEIVNLLQTFGILFRLSDAILGLTFLAWGNSIGDLVSNTAMARQGFPQMAVSACFGGPLLNMLLGIGIACTLGNIARGHPIALTHEYHQYLVSAGFLAASLTSSAIVIPLLGFRVPRAYGIYLVTLYIAYLIVSIVVELKHI